MDAFQLSAAIMHHPSRSSMLPSLMRSCEPLVPTVVTDPDPAGVPSPLRTSKLAWAAVADDATHHLVLQDDVILVDGFAEQLRDAIVNGPRAGIALFVSWSSPHHAYEARRAAAAGSAWARLGRDREWIPTLGLVIPAPEARGLAAYLAGFPDERRDEDPLVAEYCRERGLPVVAAVPHLVDHVESESLSGNQSHGERHSTVFLRDPGIGSDYWLERAWPVALYGLAAATHGVEIYNSECRIRFFRTDAGEPWSHPFGWYWSDWCSLLGIDADTVLSRLDAVIRQRFRDARASVDPAGRFASRLMVEVWAAGYLLGADVAVSRRNRQDEWPMRAVDRQLRTAIASWIDYGLTRADRALLSPGHRELLVDLGVAAVSEGRASDG
jgi:hypothetical protein